jgi:phosphatidylglycerol:prolipoprotein diacylglycerol transferase
VIVPIDPVLLTLGPLAVRWFGLLALVGLGLAVWRSLRQIERLHFSSRLALDALAWGLPAGLVMARLVNVLGWWDYYLSHASEIWQMNVDGLSLWGGLLGGGVFVFVRLKGDTLRRRRILDVVAPNVALGIAVGRLGAFLDGHGQGLPSDLPWATQYASHLAATPDFGVPRQPAQLYDALVALGLFWLISHVPRGVPAGSRLALLLVLYGAASVALGAVRLDPPFLFGLQLEQILALVAVAAGVCFGLRPVIERRWTRLQPRAGQRPHTAEDSLAA